MTDTSYSRTETAHHHPESPEAIEHEVNVERARVAETLDALQDKMSVGNIVDDVVRSFSRYGGDMAGNLGRQVRNNPLPLLLTGIGLVWLISSSGRSRSRRYDYEDDYAWDVDDDDLYEEDFVGTRRYGTTSGVRPYGTEGVGGPYREEGSAGMTGSTRGSAGSGIGSAARGAGHAASSAASGVGGAASSAARGVGDAASAAASGVSNVAGSAARGLSQAASAVGSAVSSAAGALSSGARGGYRGGRYARDGAYQAGRGAYEAGVYSMRRLDEMIHDHPLVMGALALAAGAAIGGALPRTRTEDEYIGEYSDQAKEAARETVERETEKARRVAGAVADEARNIYNEKAEEAGQRLKDAARDGQSEAMSVAERLRDAAKSEAERQNLGDPKKPS
jgi:hypothetical protein